MKKGSVLVVFAFVIILIFLGNSFVSADEPIIPTVNSGSTTIMNVFIGQQFFVPVQIINPDKTYSRNYKLVSLVVYYKKPVDGKLMQRYNYKDQAAFNVKAGQSLVGFKLQLPQIDNNIDQVRIMVSFKSDEYLKKRAGSIAVHPIGGLISIFNDGVISSGDEETIIKFNVTDPNSVAVEPILDTSETSSTISCCSSTCNLATGSSSSASALSSASSGSPIALPPVSITQKICTNCYCDYLNTLYADSGVKFVPSDDSTNDNNDQQVVSAGNDNENNNGQLASIGITGNDVLGSNQFNHFKVFVGNSIKINETLPNDYDSTIFVNTSTSNRNIIGLPEGISANLEGDFVLSLKPKESKNITVIVTCKSTGVYDITTKSKAFYQDPRKWVTPEILFFYKGNIYTVDCVQKKVQNSESIPTGDKKLDTDIQSFFW